MGDIKGAEPMEGGPSEATKAVQKPCRGGEVSQSCKGNRRAIRGVASGSEERPQRSSQRASKRKEEGVGASSARPSAVERDARAKGPDRDQLLGGTVRSRADGLVSH